MSKAPKRTRTADDLTKETPRMSKRLASLATLAAVTMVLVVLPSASASAASPWWQVLTGARPTSMWEPTDNVQEIQTQMIEFAPGLEGVAMGIEVNGKVVGCLGTQNPFGTAICEGLIHFPPQASAAELEATLEAAFGTDQVVVSGGPVGGAPFLITVPDRGEPAIQMIPGTGAVNPFAGSAKAKLISPGGSGRLVLTLTNLGDAPLDATTTPLTVVDKLPEGVIASGAEAFAGVQGIAGPVECAIAAADEVSCSFEDELPSYEAIEIEVLASLTGSPPAAGAAGEVTVSGGNGPTVSVPQTVKVGAEPTPFGIERFSTQSEEEGGASTTQAGGHPFQLTNTVQLNSGALLPAPSRTDVAIEQPAIPRNLRFPLPPGLVGNATVMAQCDMSTFLGTGILLNSCPDASAIGVASVTVIESATFGLIREAVPVFNLPPGQGEPARFGFMPAGDPVIIDTSVDPDNGYRVTAAVRNTTQLVQFLSSTVSLWGTPGDPRHDSARGWNCTYKLTNLGPCQRPPSLPETAFLRQPVSCASPLAFGMELEPWNAPIGSVVDTSSSTSDPMVGCNRVPFDPKIASTATSKLAENPSGLDFELTMPNSGLLNPAGIAEGQAKKVEVTLPKGVTINPSEGEGLVGCSPAAYARETASSAPGEGCPEAAKIGEVQVSTPLLKEEAHGSLYVATPHDNPSNSLIALYMVARIPERGILIKQAGKVAADPKTGQLTTTFDDLPQLPFDTFRLHFREGGRAPLVTPPICGTFQTEARFTPWSAADPNNPSPEEVVTRSAPFTIERGVNGGACPSAGTPPFKPGLDAGTLNNAAGRYSPFNLRLTRNDGEQEFTRFSIKLPPGITGKLAGIPFCSDAQIAAAKARTGPNGGQEELESPSCPAASQVGRTLVGAGVGSLLTYVPGKIYLAAPYNGSALSIAAITAAKVGPFDLGTVVIRQALKINPETAEVFIDPTGSDPIPHVIQGIVVHARDIRAYVDRPDFVLNPTSCERTSTASTLLGSGLDFASDADDQPVTVTSPFQAADCANLGFAPKLALSLKGGTKRGAHPAFKAVLRARPGDANIGRAQVTLPHSEFLENAHIKTICTRVQFAQGSFPGEKCPQGSIYGYARAITPLLDEPIQGPVFLRSSSHPLPDLVAALHSGRIDVNLVGRIDSVKGGRIRNTFESVPDAPVTKFTLTMQGGKKGLLVNSTNLCKQTHRAIADFTGQNGKKRVFKPKLQPKCAKQAKQKARGKAHSTHRRAG